MTTLMESATAPEPGPPAREAGDLARWWQAVRTVRGALTLVVFAVVVVTALSTDGFLTASNARAILASTAFTGLVASGLTLIMVNGNLFSLSLGSTLAVAAMVYMSLLGHGLAVAVAAALVAGAAITGLQGWVIATVRANPIVVTLAGATIANAVTARMSHGRSLTPPSGVAGYDAMSRNIAGIPISVLAMLAVALLAQLWLSRTVTGRTTFLIGTSLQAAVASGLPVTRVTTTVFGIAGITAAIGGVMLASFNDNASLAMSGTYNYDAIAAAVVGGAAVAGGRGSVLMTLVGALFITTVGDLVLLRGYGTGQQILAKGVIVVVFVLLTSRAGRARS